MQLSTQIFNISHKRRKLMLSIKDAVSQPVVVTSLFHQKSKIAHSVMECTFTFVQWSSIHTIHSVALVSPACAPVVIVVS